MISIHEQTTPNGFSIGWITLEQPRTLNALTLDMAITARQHLDAWATRPDIACVVLRGEGRAFCAGGDVRRMREGILAGDDYCERFFEQEYRLDYALHRYPKPVLAWGHGIVMGGGLGLFMGASHRVVTGSTRLAMPETNIGLYPDVGASFFLNQLPQGLGMFLGITGCEWNGADALALGMAHHLLDDSSQEQLPALLANQHWTETGCASTGTNRSHNHDTLHHCLEQLPKATIEPQLTPQAAQVAACCQGTLEQAVATLPSLPVNEAWFTQAMHNLTHGCPVTAHIVARQLQRGAGMALADAFRMEWVLSVQCTRHADFPEGVRAQLVDKDKQPRWQFSTIAAVPPMYIDEHFTLPAGWVNPLGNLG